MTLSVPGHCFLPIICRRFEETFPEIKRVNGMDIKKSFLPNEMLSLGHTLLIIFMFVMKLH